MELDTSARTTIHPVEYCNICRYIARFGEPSDIVQLDWTAGVPDDPRTIHDLATEILEEKK